MTEKSKSWYWEFISKDRIRRRERYGSFDTRETAVKHFLVVTKHGDRAILAAGDIGTDVPHEVIQNQDYGR